MLTSFPPIVSASLLIRLIERRLHVLGAHANAAAASDAADAAADAAATSEASGSSPLAHAPAAEVVVGADEFFPVLVWVVLHATPPRITSELAYIGRFRSPDRLRGVSGCYFTHLRAAVHFLQMAACGPEQSPSMALGVADEVERSPLASAGSEMAATTTAPPTPPSVTASAPRPLSAPTCVSPPSAAAPGHPLEASLDLRLVWPSCAASQHTSTLRSHRPARRFGSIRAAQTVG